MSSAIPPKPCSLKAWSASRASSTSARKRTGTRTRTGTGSHASILPRQARCTQPAFRRTGRLRRVHRPQRVHGAGARCPEGSRRNCPRAPERQRGRSDHHRLRRTGPDSHRPHRDHLVLAALPRPHPAQPGVANPFERIISKASTSREHFRRRNISPYFRVNGYPPVGADYERQAVSGFSRYRLPIGGLVESPVSLSQGDLRRLGEQSQITKHNCFQGWTAVAEWGGVPLERIIQLLGPQERAKHIVFYSLDDKGLTEGEGRYGFFSRRQSIHKL
ncbi:hypothetical protein B5P43_23420 [Bacillus sp. SRB_336]|nr:hypothetical protein B5P43_23420 [Bacillus sp. SRB_336]